MSTMLSMKSAAALTISALAVVAAGIFGVGAMLATPSTGDDFGGPVEVGPSGTDGHEPTRAPTTPTPTPTTPTPTVTTPPPDDTGGQPVEPPPPVRPGDDDGDDDDDELDDDGDDDGDDDD